MFCHQEDKDASLSCELKWVYEVISFISLICSIFVVYVTVKKIKMNIIHKLIVQIIVSEIIDEINILLSIISDSQGKMNFENYDFRMHICFTQIYLSVFSCIWTLTSSFFISIKLYDIIINKNRIFKRNNFLSQYLLFITISVPIIISYILWAVHVGMRVTSLQLDQMYIDKRYTGTQYIKLIFCWLGKEVTIPLTIIVAILILGNIYFSIFRGWCFLRRMKNNIIEQTDEDNFSANNRIKSIESIQGILFLYPIISCLIWLIFFLFIFLFYFRYGNETSTVSSIFFCIFMTIRQTIYVLVYFLSQKNLRKYTLSYLKCQCNKKSSRTQSAGVILKKLDSIEEE